jgi:hypothetical protein
VLSAIALSLDPPAKGWAIFGCVVAYNVALPLTARAVGRSDWVALWAFLLPLSVFQVAPDWFLAGQLETLVFPDVGGPRLGGEIQLAMAGMWVTPLFLALTLARGSAARAAGLALLIFLGSELAAPVLDLWEPRNATEVAGVALYVLPPEAALGWAAMTAFLLTRERPVGGEGRRRPRRSRPSTPARWPSPTSSPRPPTGRSPSDRVALRVSTSLR